MAFSTSQTDFVIALDSCTPLDILRDEVLLTSLHRFFRKGTADECFKLLPEEFRSDKRFKRINPLRTPGPATPQPRQPQDTRILAEEYFRRLIPHQESRLKRLVKVAQRITGFQIQEIVDPTRFCDEDSILETSIPQAVAIVGPGSVCDEDPILKTSIARAEAIFKQISSKQDTKSYRYNLLYYSNAVDQYESLQLVVSQGRRNKSIAFDTISRGDQKRREIARRTYSHACRYLECSEIGGPGSILSMNAPKFDMENLSNEDIRLLCDYRKLHASIEKQSRSLDFVVVKELIRDLLAQGIEKVDITKGLTRLTKLICRYVDTKSFADDGKVLPKLVSADSNENCKPASQSPAGPESGTNIRLSSRTFPPEQQGPVPISHALQSQQTYCATGPRTNIAKKRKFFEIECLQLPTICSIPTPGNTRSITQAESQQFLMNALIHSEQQHNSVTSFEQLGNIENERVSPTSLVEAHEDLVPILEDMEDTNLPSYGLSDLLGHDGTSYCFGEI